MKNATGRSFTLEEYRSELSQRHQCLRCGIIGVSNICDTCKEFKRCNVCTIILREGKYYFYVYLPKGKKNRMVEYKYLRISPYPPFSENLCVGCIEWDRFIKDRCYRCDAKFDNDRENFKKNGNFCGLCDYKFQENYILTPNGQL